MENNESISTDDVSAKNEQDKRCSPDKKYEFGSCLQVELLVEMAKAYNKEFDDNKIDLGGQKGKNMSMLNPKRYKKYLLREFKNRLKNKCTTQKCWSQQAFIRNMNKHMREELEKYTWRPEGPDTGTEWLNNQQITEVLEQYEKKYKDFKFLGALPRDFQDHPILNQSEKMYDELLSEGITKFGMVYNTDRVGGPGEHWNAMFADLAKGQVYFFDSYGVAPNSDVRKHMRMIERFIKNKCGKIAEIERNRKNLSKDEIKCKLPIQKDNNERHQYKGSECGVYSMNFIIRMLDGDSFEKICKSKVSDDDINKFRSMYFRKETS